MKRQTAYLSIIIIVLFGIFIATFFDSAVIERAAPRDQAINSPAASSTLSVAHSLSASTSSLESDVGTAPLTETSTTSVLNKNTSSISESVSAPVALPASINAALDVSAAVLRSALVNIICYVPLGSGIHSISGSGVIIDPKGVILTNAHIAQYFLLADRGVSCTIRTGSPATDKYEASLIYISSTWLSANASVIAQAAPSGTGEHDIAFLAITKSTTSTPLPSSFQFLPLASMPPSLGTPVVIGSYGAQFLESSQVQSALFPTIVFGSVKNIFTFATSTIDVIALGGSAAAQEGSSGGGIADSSGFLVGAITTSTTQGATATRSLSAITASYIRFDYANETGKSLNLLLSEPIATAVADFAPSIPALESVLQI